MSHHFLILLVAAFGLLTSLASPALAVAGDEAGAETQFSAYAEAKALVDAGNFVAALPALLTLTTEDAGNADAWNLLGYTHRNLGQMEESSASYLKVLQINPDHLGALEYQGELFLQTGKPDLARANLDRLKVLCGTCEEADDLDKAIQAAGA